MLTSTNILTNNKEKQSKIEIEEEEKHFIQQSETKIKIIDEENIELESNVQKLKKEIVLILWFIAGLTCFLEGYLIIFIGYNSTSMMKNWNWKKTEIDLLNYFYHLFSAFGNFFSIFTCKKNSLNGLYYALILHILTILCSFPLLDSKSQVTYLIIVSMMCFSNAHIQNISMNLFIQKVSPEKRAFLYGFIDFYNQFGKCLFSFLIFRFSNTLLLGSTVISLTVIPLFFSIISIFILTVILLYIFNKKIYLKNKIKKDNNKPKSAIKENVMIKTDNIIEKCFIKPLKIMLSPHFIKSTFYLAFLNIMLGIEFFSIINVFPHIQNNLLGGKTFIEEIYYSKLVHTTIFALIPFILILKISSRKNILVLSLLINLSLNQFLYFDILNSGYLIHVYRFFWNVTMICTNLYGSEICFKNLRNFFTSLLFVIYKISCLMEIVTIDLLIDADIKIPIIINTLLVFVGLVVVFNFEKETHYVDLHTINFPNHQ